MLEYALKYALLGWRVFPCVPREKRPLTKHGVHDATTDLAEIRKWWESSPDANIAVACGDKSGARPVAHHAGVAGAHATAGAAGNASSRSVAGRFASHLVQPAHSVGGAGVEDVAGACGGARSASDGGVGQGHIDRCVSDASISAGATVVVATCGEDQ